MKDLQQMFLAEEYSFDAIDVVIIGFITVGVIHNTRDGREESSSNEQWKPLYTFT